LIGSDKKAGDRQSGLDGCNLQSVVPGSVVDPNPKESEYFGWIRSRKKLKIKFFVKNRKPNT
jgi:hypothetical protein